MKAWLDDFLFFAPPEQALIDLLRRFPGICLVKHLVISLTKSDFFNTEATCFGRLIDADRVRYSPQNAAAIVSCNPPLLAGEL